MIRKALAIFRQSKKRRYLALLQSRGLKIGDGVSIEDNFFFDPSHCYLIEIRSRCTLAPNVRLIAHDASTKRALGVTRLGRIIIEEECFIGDSVIILPGVTIGRGSIIGAGAIVTKSIPAGSVAAGNPAHVVASVQDYKSRQEACLSTGVRFGTEYHIEWASMDQLDELVSAASRGPTFIT